METVRGSGFHGRITGTSSHSDMICNCDKINVISILISINIYLGIINLYLHTSNALKVKAQSESLLSNYLAMS